MDMFCEETPLVHTLLNQSAAAEPQNRKPEFRLSVCGFAVLRSSIPLRLQHTLVARLQHTLVSRLRSTSFYVLNGFFFA